jgi:hypothetical protein
MSQNNSDNEEEDNDDVDDDCNMDMDGIHLLPSPRSEYQIHEEEDDHPSSYRQLTFHEVEKSIEKYYDCETHYSNEFDLLITYLNGQKHLFLQSQNFTQTKLNLLIVPSLIMSAMITLFLPLSGENHYWFTTLLVSVLNGSITLLISLVNYYRLESTQSLFGYFAKQYEKLQTEMEFKNNRLLFVDKKNQKQYIFNEIQILETKMNDIKSSSPLSIPEEFNRLFPVISHINVFSVIKKIENYRTDLLYKFRDVKNEIRYILYKKKGRSRKWKNDLVVKQRLHLLLQTKDKIRKQIVSYQNSYHFIDSIFNREIKFAESYRTVFLLFSCFFSRRNALISCDEDISVDVLNIISQY